MLPGAVGIDELVTISPARTRSWAGVIASLAGRAEIEETIDGVRYRVSAGSFFQVNVEIVGRIFEFDAAGALEHPRRIVDLYCGAGTFSLFFAQARLSRSTASRRARKRSSRREGNAALNGSRIGCASVPAASRTSCGRTRRQPRCREAEIIFLDPPRKGCDEVTLGAIAEAGAPYIWYLSCDPATLARDLKFLAAKGYRLGVVQPFDMFPQTGHVETLVTLYRETEAAQSARRGRRLRDVAPPARGPTTTNLPKINGSIPTLSSEKIDVRYVAKLARIALTDEEVERFGAQLGDLLEHVERARRARHHAGCGDRASRRIAQRRARRRCAPVPRPRGRLERQAPQRQGGFFRVPRIIAE